MAVIAQSALGAPLRTMCPSLVVMYLRNSTRRVRCSRPARVASLSLLTVEEGAGTDPEFREGLEILLVSARDGVFLPAFHAQTVFPG